MTPAALAEETGPRSGAARIDALDALRGVAVLGIFAINIIGFSMPEGGFSNPKVAGGDGWLNYGLWTFSSVFVEGSMRGLFSLMFGAGVILFTERSRYPDGPIRVADLYYRRNILLIVFGLVHAYALLMKGDILLIYGIAALFLFPFRILPAKTLAIFSVCVLVGLTIDALRAELPETALGEEALAIEARAAQGVAISESELEMLDAWREAVERNWPPTEEQEAEIAERTADIVSIFRVNAEVVTANNTFDDILWWCIDAFMMMLLGMAFYKWRILTGERSIRLYALLAAIGYGVGLTFRIWAVSGRWAADFSPILWAWGSFDEAARVAVTIGHVGAFFLLWKAFAASLPMRALTAAGRMALTNYIGQTVIANLIFTGVGLGLYGSLDRSAVYAIMLAIWAFQLAFSMWWLARFRFGPLEWAWRSMTYGRTQALRLASTARRT